MGLDNFNTTEISINESTNKKLKEQKRDHETCEEFIERLLREDQAMRDIAAEFDMGR